MRSGQIIRIAGRGVLFSALGVTFMSAGVLAVEAALALGRRYGQPAIGPGMRATFGPAHAPTLRLAMLGDSTAAGAGVHRVADTVGGQLAGRLAGTGVRVALTSAAVSGSRTADLDPQVSRTLLIDPPDIAVVLVGSADVVHLSAPSRVADELTAAVVRLLHHLTGVEEHRDLDAVVAAVPRQSRGLVVAGIPVLRVGDAVHADTGVLADYAGVVDVVVANPPYIPLTAYESVATEVRDHDPGLALWSGDDGLDAMGVIERVAYRLLRTGGVVGVEHADVQGESAPGV